MNDFSEIKQLIRQMTATMYSFNEVDVRRAMRGLLSDQCIIHMPHPLGDMQGADDLYDKCYGPLLAAMPDLERRDWILMAGESEHGPAWLTLLVVGHAVVPLMILLGRDATISPWLAILILALVTLVGVYFVLPRAKGAFIALIWMTGATGQDVFIADQDSADKPTDR
ncbi:MAG: DUF983 domain-containing protein [Pseudomonadales bacterium]